jgi:uncharacterized protein (DUF2267 family)
MAVRKAIRALDDVDVIDTTVHKTYRWIDEISEELGGIGRREAYRDLRAFLQTLRDRLTVDLAAELGAQLPMLIRGIYYEAWDPSRAPVKMNAEEFVETFIDAAPGTRAAGCARGVGARAAPSRDGGRNRECSPQSSAGDPVSARIGCVVSRDRRELAAHN